MLLTGDRHHKHIIRLAVSFISAAFVIGMVLHPVMTKGGALITDLSPTGFFTNVAARLLSSELNQYNLSLTNIPVYPTNEYTPAVHRLLQVTANLYECISNRTFGLTPEYPYCPSVYRPIFRRIDTGTNAIIVIAGYREVVDASMADPKLAPAMVELDQPNPPLSAFPTYGTSFSALEKNEPMVSGVPLIIGARKGFPNFNELSMQTEIYVSRLLEFRRVAGDINGPIVQTNQMYVLGITNVFGLEAWNSYLTNYPRDLQLLASVNMTAIMTNDAGTANVMVSNRVAQAMVSVIPAGTWRGWSSPASVPNSMILPFGSTNSFAFLPNSTVVDQFPWVVPQTHIFPASTQGAFPVPHWWLNLNTRLLFILVDTQANRIIDYVNLNHWEPTVDISSQLQQGSTINLGDYKNPANQWLTNRLGNSSSPDVATFGVINQIQVGLVGVTDWTSFIQDPFAGLDVESAVDGFRYNFGLSPIYAKDLGKAFYRSNVFYAPFDPYRPFYVHTTWQANDPLVHFLPSDLIDLSLDPTNRVNFVSFVPPLSNLGQINNRYSPWGGNPISTRHATDYQMAVKDPRVFQSDTWDFPTNQSLGVEWLGRVHRGTPWQSIFLKSTNILAQTGNFDQDLLAWAFWTGDDAVKSLNPRPGLTTADALFTAPTNDWHLVSTLNLLFNTNSLPHLASVNQNDAQSWEVLLDGMTVFTNVSRTEIDQLVMSSNSPQAAVIAQAILQERTSQPNQVFESVGDILATPELSLSSPWLNATNLLTDEAIESIPSQLLSLLRADSVGSVMAAQGSFQIQFSGSDPYSYDIQVSSNLFDWTTIATNQPINGILNFIGPPTGGSAQFYRSKLP